MNLSSPAAADRHAPLVLALATTTTIQILSTLTALALTAIAPEVGPQIGIDAYHVGYQISLIYAAGMIASALAGTLVARHGAVAIEQAALAGFGAGLLGLASGSVPLMAAASLAIGIGYGLQNPASSQILGQVTPPHRRSLVFSIKQAGVPIGAVCASLLFPLLSPAIGWRAALGAVALAPLAMILVLHCIHAGEPRRAGVRGAGFLPGFVREQRLVLRHPPLRDLAVLGLLYSSVQLSLSAFTVTLLVAQGWSVVAAGGVAAWVNGCGAIGRVAWGGVADRYRAGFGTLAVIGLMSAGCMIAIGWLAAMPIVLQLVLFGLFGFCISGWNGVMMAEMTHHCAPADTGRVIGGGLVYTFLGVSIGPAGFATLYDHVGSYGAAFQIASVIPLAGAILALRRALRR